MPRLNVKKIVEMPHYTNTINYVAKKDKCSKPMYGAYNAYLPMNRRDVVPAIREQFDTAKAFYGKENRRSTARGGRSACLKKQTKLSFCR